MSAFPIPSSASSPSSVRSQTGKRQMADSFQFELVSPEQLLLSEAVTAVNVPGAEGYFTVMAHHAPVMTTLKPGVVVATLEGGAEQRIFVLCSSSVRPIAACAAVSTRPSSSWPALISASWRRPARP